MDIWLTNLPIGRRLFMTLMLMVLSACSAMMVTGMLSLRALSGDSPEAAGSRLLIVLVNGVAILLLLLLTALLGGVIHRSITRPLIDLAELAGCWLSFSTQS